MKKFYSHVTDPPPDKRQICGPETYMQPKGSLYNQPKDPPLDQRQICGPETFTRPKSSYNEPKDPPPDKRQICGPETFVRPKPSSIRSQPSPPTRQSPDVTDENVDPNERKLIVETWQMLAHVTYIRVIIENVIWTTKCPRFISEEAKHHRSPREKGQIFVQYQVPLTTPLTPRGSQKTVKVTAKKFSDKAIIFSDRHVVLCRMSPSLVELWIQTSLEFKFFYRAPNRKTRSCFAKCNVPLGKVLTLPFSFDSTVPLELTQELSMCKGDLKVCVQLGSRIQYFLERVEPMRNPTTAVSPITFWDPTKVNALVEKIPQSDDLDDSHQHIAVEKHSGRNKSASEHSSDFRRRYDDDFEYRGGSGRVISPLPMIPSARSDKNSAESTWRRVYPIISTQESSLHNGVWKEDFDKLTGRSGGRLYSSHYGAWDLPPRNKNETFLMPEENPPRPLNVVATSSPLPEVDPISFWNHDDAFLGGRYQRPTLEPERKIDVEIQTTWKVMVDKETESACGLYSPQKKDSGVQTSPGSVEKSEVSNNESLNSSENGRHRRRSSSGCSHDKSKRRSTTVAERLKTNLRNVDDRKHSTNDEFDRGQNEAENDRCVDPFVDLMPRAFIADKLRNNIGELNDLLINIRIMLDDNADKLHSKATSSWPISSSPPTSSRTITLRQELDDELKSAVEPD